MLVPPPFFNLGHYHGILVPNARDLNRVSPDRFTDPAFLRRLNAFEPVSNLVYS